MNLDKYVIDEFLELLGSNAPAPGGGAAAALTGSIGMALSEMVCSLTLASPKYADCQEQTEAFIRDIRELKFQLLSGMDKDAQAYSCVSAAYKMPKATDKEKAARTAAIQEALKICVQPPIELMRLGVAALELTEELLGKTTTSAISDIGVAALNLGTAVKSAWLNVLINIGSMKDKELAEGLRAEGEELLAKSEELSERIYEEVKKAL